MEASTAPRTAAELDVIDAFIDQWLMAQLEENPIVDAVDRLPEEKRRWFVRLLGEEKDVFTIRFDLRQRTLSYETYLMPSPDENHAAFYEHILKRNLGLYGASLAIGEEGAIFLQGRLDDRHATDADELDRILGSMYVWVEQFFKPALRIGFATRFGAS